jgi:hypothetical protein
VRNEAPSLGCVSWDTRDDFPQDWATVTSNKGALLATMGVRDAGPTGTGLIREATELLQQVESVWTRDLPMRWADNRLNLAEARLTLASRTTGEERTNYLDEASTDIAGASEVFASENLQQQSRLSRLRVLLSQQNAP